MDQNNTVYIPHSALEGLPVKISIHKIWDENSILSSLIDESSKEDKDQYFIQCQLVINGLPQQPIKYIKILRRNQMLDDDIVFSNNYKDLSYNSLIAITLWSTNKPYDELSPLGSTVLPLFDDNFQLREGKHNLLIWPNVPPDISFESKTPGLVLDKNIQNLNFCTQKIEQYEKNTTQTKDTNENLSLSNLRLKLLYCYKTIPAAFIEIQLPVFPIQVLYEDFEYQFDEQQLEVLGGGYNMQNTSSIAQSVFNNLPVPKQSINNLHTKTFLQVNSFSDCIVIADYDFELQRPHLIQNMTNAVLRNDEHPETLKPNKEELETLMKLMKRPIIGEMFRNETVLFWRFRYFLQQHRQALPFFLYSTDWGNQDEEQEAMKLLQNWAPIDSKEISDIADPLFLLSSFTTANEIFVNKRNKRAQECMKVIRKYAVNALEQFSDDQLESVLLQLVQALKYEDNRDRSPLSVFLFERANKNRNLATLLYWYLHVEQDVNPKEGNNSVTIWYNKLFNDFSDSLKTDNNELYNQIQCQSQFRLNLQKLSRTIKNSSRSRQEKIQMLQNDLSKDGFQNPKILPENPCCLKPELLIQRAIPEKTIIFSSAMAPIRFTFEAKTQKGKSQIYQMIYKNGDDLRQDQLIMQLFNFMDVLLKNVNNDMKLLPYKILACSKSDGFMEFVPETKTLQDVLGEGSMSQYLKKISEDSENQFYESILPEGYKDFKSQESQEFIKRYIEEQVKRSFNGINPAILDNYILSCAGYCVLTYFLGVGDRHLENLLINKEGKMFHIDFGFIFGKDPKPSPPPVKLCKEMIEGMTGSKTDYIRAQQYNYFRQKCVDIYNYLRKYAKLIVTLISLMSDAGQNQIHIFFQDALEALYDKFRLDDSDQEAEKHFLNIVENSVNALFSIVNDKIHKWVSYMRK